MLTAILAAGKDYPRSYLIRREKDTVADALWRAAEEAWGIIPAGNPNVLSVNAHMGVDEARSILDFAALSPFGDDALKIILLSAERVTREAQNVLLKLTEEPNASLRIFVVVPRDVELLPTLLSRLDDISFAFEETAAPASGTDAKNFLSLGLKERLAMAEKIAKNEDETATDAFLRSLEKKIAAQKYKDAKERERALAALAWAKRAAGEQGRPKRMIIETLSVALPLA